MVLFKREKVKKIGYIGKLIIYIYCRLSIYNGPIKNPAQTIVLLVLGHQNIIRKPSSNPLHINLNILLKIKYTY